MALVDSTWYCNAGDQSTTGYYAVAKRPQNTSVAAGIVRRQFTAPAVGSERAFICIIAGVTANVVDATWVLTRGSKTTDGTVTWMECTGQAALNGDLTNTATWAQVKAATPAVLGQIIKRSNNASYQICTTAGAMSAAEPAFSDTAGVTTTDTTAVWTSLGVVGNFSNGGAPFARLVAACAVTWFAIGNTIYVADNHAESQTTIITLSPAGNTQTVGRILCHNHSGSYPPAASDLTTGAVITTTGNANIVLSPGGSIYLYGLTFRVAVGQSSINNFNIVTGSSLIYLDRCLNELATTGGSAQINISGSGVAVFDNTTVKFGNTGQNVNVNTTQFIWQNTGQVLAAGSLVPINFITVTSFIVVVLEALDLSQITGNIIGSASTGLGTVVIKDCKLNASAAIPTTTTWGAIYQLVRCDSTGTAYKSARYAYEGTETTETTITRDGGAADPTGQAQSRKLVTTANAQWLRPFKAEPYGIWNTVTGANVTVTVYGTINAGALPNNDDIWLEVEYLGSSATPLGTIVTTTKASLLATNAAVASDGSTWNGGGSGAGWLPFKLTKTLSSPQPGLAGYVHARVRAAKASTTYYIDPTVVLT